jgi:HEPN domain-containing protein
VNLSLLQIVNQYGGPSLSGGPTPGPSPSQLIAAQRRSSVDQNKRKMIEGWLTKASAHLHTAKEDLQSIHHITESIQASQVCVELSVKSILTTLEIEYPTTHGWDHKQLAKIAQRVHDRKLLQRLADHNLGHIRLARLLTLVNFWDQFYLQAKYGIEAGNLAPPQDLFDHDEAELAAKHAYECWAAANHFRHLTDDVLAAILAEPGS